MYYIILQFTVFTFIILFIKIIDNNSNLLITVIIILHIVCCFDSLSRLWKWFFRLLNKKQLLIFDENKFL